MNGKVDWAAGSDDQAKQRFFLDRLKHSKVKVIGILDLPIVRRFGVWDQSSPVLAHLAGGVDRRGASVW